MKGDVKNSTGKYSLSDTAVPKGSKGSTDKMSANKYSLANCKK